MSELLFLKSLGNEEINNEIHKVEVYQDKHRCLIYTKVYDEGILAYDDDNVLLLNIKVGV